MKRDGRLTAGGVRHTAGCPAGVLFVGERRSRRAVAMGMTWEDGRLAARSLFDALRAAGLGVDRHRFVNLYPDAGGAAPVPEVARQVRRAAAGGVLVVALGRKVSRGLDALGVRHAYLTHPAARGAVRRKETYAELVAYTLGGTAVRKPQDMSREELVRLADGLQRLLFADTDADGRPVWNPLAVERAGLAARAAALVREEMARHGLAPGRTCLRLEGEGL